MGKYKKLLCDHAQTFTHIRGLKVMNICQIVAIILIKNKSYGQKHGVTVELDFFSSFITTSLEITKLVNTKTSVR